MAESPDTNRAEWRTSSYSNNGGDCVEVAPGGGVVGVRDTKDRTSTVLAFEPRAWRRFADSLKA
jgi:hypothetical protein